MQLTWKQQVAIEQRWRNANIPSEYRTLVAGALRVAADVYQKDAIATSDTPRVTEQFQRQADECLAIADLVEP